MINSQVRIGAESTNDIVLHGDEFVSGHHAVIRAENNCLYVTDTQSRNGCELNGQRFRSRTRDLRPNDALVIGRTTLTIKADDGA
jgi:pSer/pThr/pTyr-binding forkhead associated (FHA) protein